MLTTFGFLDPPELVIILVIALVIFGPGKLPELGKSLGKGISEFKAATNGEPEKKKEAVGEPDKKDEPKNG
ncbi:Sec-independent protein translocase protein TatA/E [Acididesulfobacillus acetoxydans]|uniref:Sec-independent protein translocase protein TatA n=1 Tax=Acididesulfobacillus acetoxydans TaxID=1561005 RepID=A0A8S0W4F2_9FIRM|nr:twin-arginine translocase TatA/TatE family subunit [Acididesulfobacillus acetoxydans]CAA7602368.1 Sec-independent protein translocase protein TatA/E [Acididesulfobacillus acetoxydans]CEJ08397.1 Sec-independent protein translocase protein TatA [tatA] [Acididesulfobacillus acetoxydans]